MGKSSAPPLAKDVIRRARLAKFMSQADVIRELAERGVVYDQGNWSRIESGQIRWPKLRHIPVIADVLGIKPGDLLDDDEAEAA